jgi:hypothetical protein
MINSNNRVVVDMAFYNDPDDGSSANFLLYNYDINGNKIGQTQMFGGRLILSGVSSFFDIAFLDGQLQWIIDVGNLPSSSSGLYYGQIYRNGSTLCVKI